MVLLDESGFHPGRVHSIRAPYLGKESARILMAKRAKNMDRRKDFGCDDLYRNHDDKSGLANRRRYWPYSEFAIGAACAKT